MIWTWNQEQNRERTGGRKLEPVGSHGTSLITDSHSASRSSPRIMKPRLTPRAPHFHRRSRRTVPEPVPHPRRAAARKNRTIARSPGVCNFPPARETAQSASSAYTVPTRRPAESSTGLSLYRKPMSWRPGAAAELLIPHQRADSGVCSSRFSKYRPSTISTVIFARIASASRRSEVSVDRRSC